MRCLSLLENITESISASCPPSTGKLCIVLPCSTFQILILPSLDPDTTCLSSYENAIDRTQSLSGECPNKHYTCLHFPSLNCFVYWARHDPPTVKQEHNGCHLVCVPTQAPMTNSPVPESHILTLPIGGPWCIEIAVVQKDGTLKMIHPTSDNSFDWLVNKLTSVYCHHVLGSQCADVAQMRGTREWQCWYVDMRWTCAALTGIAG